MVFRLMMMNDDVLMMEINFEKIHEFLILFVLNNDMVRKVFVDLALDDGYVQFH